MCTAMLIVSDEVETSKLHHPPWPTPQHLLSSRLPGLTTMAQTQLASGWLQQGWGYAGISSPGSSHAFLTKYCWRHDGLGLSHAGGGDGWGGSCSWSHRPSTRGGWLTCDSHLPRAAGRGKQRGNYDTKRNFSPSPNPLPLWRVFFPADSPWSPRKPCSSRWGSSWCEDLHHVQPPLCPPVAADAGRRVHAGHHVPEP